MATATMNLGDGSIDEIADWLSHEAIDLLESIETEIDCRIDAWQGRTVTVLKDAMLTRVRARMDALLTDLRGGLHDADASVPDAPGQKVLPLRGQAGKAPAAPGTADAASASRARASREPKEGSIAARVVTFLTANPDKAFTVTALTNGIGGQHSSGAVDAACKRMSSRGDLTQVGDNPRTYRLPESGH